MGGGCWGTPIVMGCCSGVTAADCSMLGYRLDAVAPFVSIAHRNLLGFGGHWALQRAFLRCVGARDIAVK